MATPMFHKIQWRFSLINLMFLFHIFLSKERTLNNIEVKTFLQIN